MAAASSFVAGCPADAVCRDDAETTPQAVGSPAPPPAAGQHGAPRDIVVTAVPPPAATASGAIGIGDLLKRSPGVTFVEGNGPRDVGLSIRGSNARIGSGVRNIVVREDGFPVTQPNGIARLDLADPHAYRNIVVERGPASARYGNYALEGAIDFHTRRGGDVDGVEAGVEAGSFGYADVHALVGGRGDRHDYALFASAVHGDGAVGHSGFDVATLNGTATIDLDARDAVTAKLIYNAGTFALPLRLSFVQFRANPYQQGCLTAATAQPGCGTFSVPADGINGDRVPVTAAEAGVVSNDRRIIGGLRVEHRAGADTDWRLQALLDRRHVDQPSGALVSRGDLDSYSLDAGVTLRRSLAGHDTTTAVGAAYGYLDNRIGVFQRSAGQGHPIGAISQTIVGTVRNARVFARETVEWAPTLSIEVGAGAERSLLDADQTAFAYPLAGGTQTTPVVARRRFWNVATDAGLTWRPVRSVTVHARAASAYGIPQLGQLFVTAAGAPGDNAGLRTQTNRGLEIGAAVQATPTLSAEATIFDEWFRDEQVTTAAGINLLPFTTNAPRSIHRGVELALRWRPASLPGGYLDATYSFDDQRYRSFTERLTSATASLDVDRSGQRIPGVIPHFATARLGYDRSHGRGAGLGAFAEATVRSAYPLDNGGRLSVPGYALLNLDIHYAVPRRARATWRPGVFLTVRNVADHRYVGSALVVADLLDRATGREGDGTALAAVTGSLVAGQPRTVAAGIRAAF